MKSYYLNNEIQAQVYENFLSKSEHADLYAALGRNQQASSTYLNRSRKQTRLPKNELFAYLQKLKKIRSKLSTDFSVCEELNLEMLFAATYGSEDYFNWHRDDIKYEDGTALPHRKLSLLYVIKKAQLGGELVFKDFPDLILAENSLVIFRSHLLHQVTPVQEGLRYSLFGFLSAKSQAKIAQVKKELRQNREKVNSI